MTTGPGKAALTVFALFMVLLSAAEPGAQTESAPFEKTDFDLGLLNEGVTYTFDLRLTNSSGDVLRISSAEPTCGCVEVTNFDKVIPPGDAGVLTITMNTAGKIGRVVKIIEVTTNLAPSAPIDLRVFAEVRHVGDGSVDSGAIFRGSCRKCHVGERVSEKTGEVLYNAVCYICHGEGMPLSALETGTLVKAITSGVPDTSMPPFSEASGGPLTDDQIDSLARYLKTR